MREATQVMAGAGGARLALGILCAAVACAGAPARAAEPEPLAVAAGPTARSGPQQRFYGFLVDGTTPGAGVASIGYAFGAGSGITAERPIPVDLAAGSGGSHTFSIGYGLTDRVEPFASATFAGTEGSSGGVTSVAKAGVAWQLTSPGSPLHASISGAAEYESLGQTPGVTAVAAVGLDRGPLNVAANLRADRMFGEGRDSVDLITMLGVSCRVWGGLRAGLEYVGQDLEDAFEEDAEGGARHTLGPSLSMDLERGRYQLVLASGFGLDSRSPTVIGRAGLTVSF